jgi:hypothetical protein
MRKLCIGHVGCLAVGSRGGTQFEEVKGEEIEVEGAATGCRIVSNCNTSGLGLIEFKMNEGAHRK